MHRLRCVAIIGALLGTLALGAATAAAAGYSGGAGVTAQAAAPSAASGPAMVRVATNATLGSILVTSGGMTLYIYKKDTPGHSNCSGGCAAAWPPLETSGVPAAGPGVTGTLGTVTRADGTMQVTYDGLPLYTYAADTKPGDITGQGVGNVWYVVPVQAAAATPAPASAPSAPLPKTGGGRTAEVLGALLLACGAAALLRRRRNLAGARP